VSLPVQIEAVRGDITREDVDVVVNATDPYLMSGTGVSRAIHAAAGPTLEGECRQVRRALYPEGVPVGAAVVTGAGLLPARWVIHTVGPGAHRGRTDPADLASCIVSSLRVASELGARSVAYPAIGSGTHGGDVREVARVAVRAVRGVAERGEQGSVELVRFVLLSDDALAAFRDVSAEPVPAHS
jgi:O-acetyl-ADP-ribose deacetylase